VRGFSFEEVSKASFSKLTKMKKTK
jgi:hypothetical protein